jgi:hypothetical protein
LCLVKVVSYRAEMLTGRTSDGLRVGFVILRVTRSSTIRSITFSCVFFRQVVLRRWDRLGLRIFWFDSIWFKLLKKLDGFRDKKNTNRSCLCCAIKDFIPSYVSRSSLHLLGKSLTVFSKQLMSSKFMFLKFVLTHGSKTPVTNISDVSSESGGL